MKEIAIVAYSQGKAVSQAGAANEVELIMPQLQAVYDQVGINNAQDVDFVCSGSCDYLQGAAFAFVAGVDAQLRLVDAREHELRLRAEHRPRLLNAGRPGARALGAEQAVAIAAAKTDRVALGQPDLLTRLEALTVDEGPVATVEILENPGPVSPR